MTGRDHRLREARDLFVELADEDPAVVEARLGGLDASDPDLARLVRELLESDRAAGSRFEGGAADLAPGLFHDLAEEHSEESDRSGAVVGPYRLLSLLGRGGMGEVYLAQRVDGEFDQTVALKLLRAGENSDAIRRRFLRERQLLARLDHPNIARLLDGGTDVGRPYVVLERVVGEPITDYCRSRRLDVDARVRLVASACGAVEAAHRRLVVHRDLKPSNVFVTNDGQVKLLDFGIAKALAGDGEEDATVTRVEERVLTPAYAAPEQILGEPVTTATDVYSLGVLLFELLTGRLPHQRKTISQGDLVKRVDTETAERPSRTVEREGAAAIEASGSPRDPGKLSKLLEGDLDAVVLKALRREPERRYPSAAALEDDLRRFTEGRPVLARPDTFGYRVSKFVRRNRTAVAGTALALVLLAAGVFATVWQARRAEAQARRAQRVKEFLIGIFEIADPEQAGGGSVTAKDLIEQSGRRLKTELATDPDIQADLLDSVARIERSLGHMDSAQSLAEGSLAIRRRTLSPRDPAVGSSLATLGSAVMGQGKLDDAEKKLAEALRILEPQEPLDPLAVARARSDFAQVLFWKGKAKEAEALERRVYETYRKELGPESVLTAVHLRNVGLLLDELDRMDEAEHAYRESRKILEKQLGRDHVNLAQSDSNLAVLLDRRGKAAEAEPLYRHCLEVRTRALGPSHMAVGQALQLYALFLLNQGRLDESEARYRQALALFRALDPKHFEVGKCNNGLALIASRRGNPAEAEARFREVASLFGEVLGETHHFTWMVNANLADQIAAQGRLEEAEKLQREAADRLVKIRGADSLEAADVSSRLGETLRREGRLAEAAAVERKALGVMKKVQAAGNLDLALATYRLGAALADAPDDSSRKEAGGLLAESAALVSRIQADHWKLPEILLAKGRLAQRTGDRPRAAADFREAARVAALRFGAQDARTLAAQRALSDVDTGAPLGSR